MLDTSESETLVSVVIPTYERQEYLRGAIQTALGQTYDPIEVIVVDDGSSEPYADRIVSEFPESVICITHDRNKGLSAARNTGIEAANGEYIAFLDDDDRWHKDKIARQVSTLSENKEAGLATCLVVALTPDNEIVHCETDAPSGDCSESMLIGNQIGTPSRVLVRQECFDDIGVFDESLPTKQDWDFYIRLCQKWNITAVEDHLCFRTIHDSMSSSPVSALQDNKLILDKHENLIQRRGYWRQSQAEIEERVGRAYMRQSELRRARKHFETSLRKDSSIGRILLYMLTFTHASIVERMRTLKRGISIQKNGCADFDQINDVIPEDTLCGDYEIN